MVLRKKVISVLASLAVIVGLVLGGAVPANAASGSIRNYGSGPAYFTNGSQQYSLPVNGQWYYGSMYRVPQGYCSMSDTLGYWCPTSNNVWRSIPAGQHGIKVVVAQRV